jgi:hypothetical protein
MMSLNDSVLNSKEIGTGSRIGRTIVNKQKPIDPLNTTRNANYSKNNGSTEDFELNQSIQPDFRSEQHEAIPENSCFDKESHHVE